MPSHRSNRLALIVGVAAIALSACGGDDDAAPSLAGLEQNSDATVNEPADEPSKADGALSEMLAAELLAQPDSPVRTEEEANCMSGYIVDKIGTGRLLELGISADDDTEFEDMDFSDTEIGTIIDSMFECVDIQARLAEEFAADFGEEDAKCLANGLDADTLTLMLTSAFQGAGDEEMPVEFLETFFELMVECGIEFE